MTTATLIVLVVVAAVIGVAAFNLYRMIMNHDTCSSCPNKDRCNCKKHAINCTIKEK